MRVLNNEKYSESMSIERKEQVAQEIYAICKQKAKSIAGERFFEDVAQESAIKAIDASSRFKGKSSLNTWLHRIVYNTYLAMIRKSYYKNEIQFKVLPESTYFDNINSEEDRVLEKKIWKTARNEGNARELLLFMKGMPYKTISKVLGIPLNTLKTRISRQKENTRVLLTRKHRKDLEDLGYLS
jgi:RNA polymerase sigma factor (sigma-70 family)